MSIVNENTEYRTSDLPLAAVLSLHQPVQSLDRIDPRRVVFVFLNAVELENVVKAYWKAEIRVEPRRYFDQVKHLKSLLYSP